MPVPVLAGIHQQEGGRKDAWAYMRQTFEATDCLTQIQLQSQMNNLEYNATDPNEEYLSRADTMRDELAALGIVLYEQSYILQLIKGLHVSRRWSHFKSTCTYTGDTLGRVYPYSAPVHSCSTIV